MTDDQAPGVRRLTPHTGAARPYSGGDPFADHRAAADLPFTHLPDLADRRLGGTVLAVSDEFFAERENLLAPGPARFDPDLFGPKGKVMDGWETRRRRGTAAGTPHPSRDDHDWAVIRLGTPGVPYGIVVDTAHFRGNHPPEISIEAASAPDGAAGPGEPADWTPLVPRTPIGGHAANAFRITGGRRVTHLRLNTFPDGGVARLRVHGEVVPDPRWLSALGTFDVVALENGGAVEDASDRFYSPPEHTILPGRPVSMADGWETRRRRDDGHDWVRYRLTGQALIRAAEIDTGCFRGNAAGWAALYGRDAVPGREPGEWREILPRTRLHPDTVHRFVLDAPPVTQVRLEIFPDGGIGRLRLYGSLTAEGARRLTARA